MIRKTAILAAAAAAVLALTACDPVAAEGQPSSVQQTVDAGLDPTRTASPTTTRQADPLSSNGTWLVPSEIPHGTYRTNPTRENRGGYWAVCADLMCQPGPGMIDNDFSDGPGVIVVGPDAVAVKLSHVALTLIG